MWFLLAVALVLVVVALTTAAKVLLWIALVVAALWALTIFLDR